MMEAKSKVSWITHSLAGKFALAVTLFSLVFGVVVALCIAYMNSSHAYADCQRMLDRIHVSSEETLLTGLWLTNEELVDTVLSGIFNLPGVEEVKVIREDGQILQKGEVVSRKYFQHAHPLVYVYRNRNITLGSISITIGMDTTWGQFFHDNVYLFFIILFLSLTGGALAIVMHYLLVGRHLQSLAQQSHAIKYDNLDVHLTLKRKKTTELPDELDKIVQSLNNMCGSLNQSIKEKKSKESTFEAIVTNSSDCILRFDKKNQVTYTNPAAFKQFDNNLLRQISERLSENGILDKICNDTQSYNTLMFSNLKNGKEAKTFELRFAPEQPGAGDVKSVIGIARDVTAREQQELLLRAVFDHAPLMMSISDIKTGRYCDVNEKFIEKTGYSRERALGATSLDLVSLTSENRAYIIKELQLNGFVENFEVEIRKADGSTMLCQYSGQFIDFYGDKKLLSIVQDITVEKTALAEQRVLEQQLLQATKMEAIGTLAGGIAHDFNNILGAILGYGQMALEGLSEHTSLHRDLQQIMTAGTRAAKLVKQILVFSRQGNEDIRPCQLQPIIKEICKLIRSTMPVTIDLQLDIAKDCSPAFVDPTQINQLLMNLLTNARHAIGSDHGEINISLQEIAPGKPLVGFDGKLLKDGGYIELKVEDSGSGMSPEVKARMFEPFFTTKAQGEGTGMGMAICHGILSRHKGAIVVDSVVGKGSTFSVYLPVCLESEQIMATLEEEQVAGNERLLLVDDELTVVTMMDRALTKLGYQTIAFTSSVEALRYFSNNPDSIDMVVTDMTMPQLTGTEMAQEMLNIRKGIPIILCTGYSDVVDEQIAHRLGIKSFVLKPVIIKKLASIMRGIFDEK